MNRNTSTIRSGRWQGRSRPNGGITTCVVSRHTKLEPSHPPIALLPAVHCMASARTTTNVALSKHRSAKCGGVCGIITHRVHPLHVLSIPSYAALKKSFYTYAHGAATKDTVSMPSSFRFRQKRHLDTTAMRRLAHPAMRTPVADPKLRH